MHLVYFAVRYEMIQATARAVTFVCVFEERELRAQYLFLARLTHAEAMLTFPVCCGHKDVLHLNKCNPFQEKRDRGSSCEWGGQP